MKDFLFDNALGMYVHPQKPPIDYADGGEEYVLDVIRKHPDLKACSPELVDYIKDWPSRYHLSFRRTNLLESIKELFNKDGAVLELGSGCGVLTRWLGENFHAVDAVEGSRQRAIITKERTRNLNNVKVFNGDILNISYEQGKYGLVTLVGVMEYVPYYSPQGLDHKKSCTEFLKNLSSSLRNDGILLIAIENRFGAKYFTGCPEDHTGKMFDGIIGYPDRSPVTFSRAELKEMLQAAGFKNTQFYHMFPDYKLPETFIRESDEALSLYPYNWIRTPFEEYGGERLNLIPEPLFIKTLTASKLLWEFSNSFLIVASRAEDTELKTKWLIKKFFNNERYNSVFHHEVSLLKGDDNEYQVQRRPLSHGSLRFKSADLDFNLTEVDRFVPGELVLYDVYRASVSKEPEVALLQTTKRVFDSLVSNYSTGKKDEEGYHLVDGGTVDYVFCNLIGTDDFGLCFIDRKWRFREELPADFVLFRSLYVSYVWLRPFIKEKDIVIFIAGILKKIYPDYGLERLKKNIQMEELFQSVVCNQEVSIKLTDLQPAYAITVDYIKRLESKDRQLDAMLNTWSWKITAPLRRLFKLIRNKHD